MLTAAKNEAKTTAKVVASKKTAKPVKVIYIGPSVRRVAAKKHRVQQWFNANA